jgi:predicted O-methyltransferase YrrM
MDTVTLEQLGFKHGTDKSAHGHHYLDFYERFLLPLRDSATSIMEIGVLHGQSLRMWEEYFPNAAILGVDIDPVTREYAAGRINIEIADQSKAEELEQVALRNGPFDLIIDDGSHIWSHQITTLKTLFKHVKPGGFYILEDLVTSFGYYIQSHSGDSVLSAADYLHALCDAFVADNAMNPLLIPDPFIRNEASKVEFICYYRYTSLIRRKPAS